MCWSMCLIAGRLIVSNMDTMTDNSAAAQLLREHEKPARQLLIRARAQDALHDIDIICSIKLLYGALNNIPRWFDPKNGSLQDVIDKTWEIFLRGIVKQSDLSKGGGGK
jgi:Tetracyclin repressor-like, C-terminal domain